jgi:hypothetical protein
MTKPCTDVLLGTEPVGYILAVPRGFSPLVDICYAFLWCLHCDQVLTMTSGPGQQQFNAFLQRGEGGITAATYLGTAIPGRFCPNFGFHFKPHAMMCGLPKAIPLNTLQPNLSFLLRLVTTKQPVTIKVQSPRRSLGPYSFPVDPCPTFDPAPSR